MDHQKPGQNKHICLSCGWSNTRPAKTSGFSDALLAALWLKPYRCNRCNNRFYRYSHNWARFVAPAMVALALIVMVGAMAQVRPWLRNLKQVHAQQTPVQNVSPRSPSILPKAATKR